jgi:hypothetical protein
LSEPEKRYLQAVIRQPGMGVTFYARAAGLNGQRAAEIRQRLVKEGYLREFELATSSKGRNAKVLGPLVAAAFKAGEAL